ncbi:MAG: hypothetical protein K2G03_04440, partial [Bacilli bacterium]|nr:hypothetical protein [Bacilli bacterium]
MIKDKKTIQAMIYRYMTNEEGINALGFISYHTFDKELIAKDSESINDFFRENFDLNHRVIKYCDLLKDASGKIWLSIDNLFDLELLDELIALGLAADVFEENLTFRYDEFLFNIDLIVLLNEDPENLEHYSEEDYLELMNERIIPGNKLQVSKTTLDYYSQKQIEQDYSIERKKELLLSWWNQGMKNEEDESTIEIFKEFINGSNLNGIIYLVYRLYSQNETSKKLSEKIKRGEAYSETIMAGALYYHSTPEAKKEIN